MFRSTSRLKKVAMGAALFGATLTGGVAGAALITPASAQTPTTATTATSATTAASAASGRAVRRSAVGHPAGPAPRRPPGQRRHRGPPHR